MLICRYIRRQVLLNGLTGKVAFDDNGDRIFAEYDVVNVQIDQRKVSVGRYFFSNVSITFNT
jgi:ionotropic glutamate receptor NMDA 1